MSELDDLELSAFVLRWWSVLLIAVALGGALGWIVVDRAGGGHETTASLLVGPLSANADALEGTTDLARTYGEIAESDIVIRRAADQVGARSSDVDVAASAESNTPILRIRVRTEDRQNAVELTEALVSTLAEFVGAELVDSDAIGSFSTDLGVDEIGSELTILDVSTSPAALRLPGPVGAVIGAMALLLIVGAALVDEEQRSKRHRPPKGVERLGVIPLPATSGLDDATAAIGTDEAAVLESATSARDITTRLRFKGNLAPLLVAFSPTNGRDSNSAFAQLLSGFDEPATVLATAQCPAIDGHPPRTGMFTADGRVIGHLRVTSNDRDVKGVRRILRMHEAGGVAIVHLASNLGNDHLRPWLDVADAAVFLEPPGHAGATSAALDELMTTLAQAEVPLLGSVAFKQRRSRSQRAIVQWSAESDWPTTGDRK